MIAVVGSPRGLCSPYLNIERVVDVLKRPVEVPQGEVLPDGAVGGRSFGNAFH